VESGALHRYGDFGILGEGLPDEAGAKVLGHENADAEVDAEDVGIVPGFVRMEGVTETVAGVDSRAIGIVQRPLYAETFGGKEG
jgi:hypothetical protein